MQPMKQVRRRVAPIEWAEMYNGRHMPSILTADRNRVEMIVHEGVVALKIVDGNGTMMYPIITKDKWVIRSDLHAGGRSYRVLSHEEFCKEYEEPGHATD